LRKKLFFARIIRITHIIILSMSIQMNDKSTLALNRILQEELFQPLTRLR